MTDSGNFQINQSLQWSHNERDGVSNHQPHDCLLNHLFRRRSKKTPKPRVTGLCVGNSPVTGEFPAQRASNTENVSIWWRHHEYKASENNVTTTDQVTFWKMLGTTTMFSLGIKLHFDKRNLYHTHINHSHDTATILLTNQNRSNEG